MFNVENVSLKLKFLGLLSKERKGFEGWQCKK